MSYYLFPKVYHTLSIQPSASEGEGETEDDDDDVCISFSLYQYYREVKAEIYRVLEEEAKVRDPASACVRCRYEEMVNAVNPLQFVFGKVPGSKLSVAKLKPNSNLFYDFLEVAGAFHLFEGYKSFKESIKSLHISPNHSDTIECFEMLRENFSDAITAFDSITDESMRAIGEERYDFIFCESKSTVSKKKEYIVSLMEILMVLLRNQKTGGVAMIKVGAVFCRPVVEVLYILSSLYEKVCVMKPATSNVTSFDRYVVCMDRMDMDDAKRKQLRIHYFRLVVFLKRLEQERNITSLLDASIPYYFHTRVEDMNIGIGQSQLEALDTIISILKNKNREDRMDSIRKANVQKAVTWCEKNKIPCNRFSDKTNIFLPFQVAGGKGHCGEHTTAS